MAIQTQYQLSWRCFKGGNVKLQTSFCQFLALSDGGRNDGRGTGKGERQETVDRQENTVIPSCGRSRERSYTLQGASEVKRTKNAQKKT